MLRYIPRSEVDHLSIYTDKEVVLLYNFDLTPYPPPFLIYLLIIMETCNLLDCSTCLNFRFHTLLYSSELGLSCHHPMLTVSHVSLSQASYSIFDNYYQ